MTFPPRNITEDIFINEDEIVINEDEIYGGCMDIQMRL